MSVEVRQAGLDSKRGKMNSSKNASKRIKFFIPRIFSLICDSVREEVGVEQEDEALVDFSFYENKCNRLLIKVYAMKMGTTDK